MRVILMNEMIVNITRIRYRFVRNQNLSKSFHTTLLCEHLLNDAFANNFSLLSVGEIGLMLPSGKWWRFSENNPGMPVTALDEP